MSNTSRVVYCSPVSLPIWLNCTHRPIPPSFLNSIPVFFDHSFYIFLLYFFHTQGSVSFFVKGAGNSFSFDPSTGWIVRLSFHPEKQQKDQNIPKQWFIFFGLGWEIHISDILLIAISFGDLSDFATRNHLYYILICIYTISQHNVLCCITALPSICLKNKFV